MPRHSALAAQDTDLDFDHVEPAGVLGGVVELQAPQDAASFGGREGLVEGAGRMDRQVVLHDADALGIGIMDIDEFAHALGVIFGGAPLGDLDLAPKTLDLLLLGLHLAMAGKGLNGIGAELFHPFAQHVLMNAKVAAGSRHRYPAFPDKLHRLGFMKHLISVSIKPAAAQVVQT